MVRFGRGWQASKIAAFMALAMSVAGLAMHPANAQEPAAAPAPSPAAEPAAPQAPDAAPADDAAPAPDKPSAPEETLISGDKEITEFAASLDLWTKQIKLLAETIADDQTQDVELKDVPSQLAELRDHIVAGRDRLKPKLDKLNELLTELGPAPDETKPKESPQTALARQRLSAAVVAVDGLLKRADCSSLPSTNSPMPPTRSVTSASPSPCSARCPDCSSTFSPGPSTACRFRRSRCSRQSALG